MIKLIKNAEIYLSDNVVMGDILICGTKILEIGQELNYNFKDIQIIDGKKKKAIPSYIDQHVHVTGGGGEGGFTTRVPEIKLTDCIKGGVTTIVGLMGTDATTRSIENLVAKIKALKEDGLTAYCLTGAYEYPSPTITGSVKKDIVYIEEIIGVKIAISDHRSSNITKQELVRLASQARTAGLISGKPGVVHMHMGMGKNKLSLVFDILETEDVPIKTFRPTHVAKVYEDAIKFANLGGYIDFTVGSDIQETAKLLLDAIKKAPIDKMTLSTDGNGSMPIWNDKNEMIGIGVGKITTMHEVIKSMVLDFGVELNTSLKFVTENVAKALEIYPRKGIIKPYSDADILLLDENLDIDTVIANGKVMMQDKKLLIKGNFE